MNKESCMNQFNYNPLVSVVMPCYNAQSFLGEAIQSVVEQTYSNWELLVIDDGSKDQSKTIASDWARKDIRIKSILNEENIGVSKTRNKGIEIARGTWIAFLDSDDVWEKDKLMKQIDLAQKNDANFVFTSCSVIDQYGNQRGLMSSIPERVNFKELQRWNRITCSSVIVLKSALGDLRFAHDDSREDYLLWLKVLKNLGVAYAVDEPMVRYRIISGSRSANKVKMIRDTYRVHRHLDSNPISSGCFTLSHFYHSFRNKYRHIG